MRDRLPTTLINSKIINSVFSHLSCQLNRKQSKNNMHLTWRLISSTIFCFCAIGWIPSIKSEIPAYKCELEDDFCTFWNVDLNESSYRFFPRADRALIVEKVRFYHSTIDVFGPDLCHAFPKLKIIEIYFADIGQITEDAFDGCSALEKIDIRYHKMTELKPDVFQKVPNLNFLRIDSGQLEQLPMKIFKTLTNLTVLSIADNKLKLFPPYLVKDLKNLTELWLYSNELVDLDAVGLLGNLPKLEKAYINDNDFRCDRVQPIVKAFQARNVQGLSYVSARDREEQVQKVLDIECLTTEQWNLINNEKGWKVATDADMEEKNGSSSSSDEKQTEGLIAQMGEAKLKGFCSRYCDRYYPTY